jgi:hypothetical protein
MSILLENLNTIVTIASAAAVYFLLKKSIKKDIDELKTEMEKIKVSVQSIDHRLTRLEAAFEERGKWEPRYYRNKTIT